MKKTRIAVCLLAMAMIASIMTACGTTVDTGSETEEVTEDANSLDDNNVNSSENTEQPASSTKTDDTYTYTDLSKTMYAKSTVNVRNQPSTI